MSITVFLADDHAVVRDGLRALLETQPDIRVVGEADNGRDAVRMIEKLHPDVAIIDIAMPVLNGIEAALRIHDLHISARVLILSMHSTSEHIASALNAGVKGYMVKDSAGAELITAVRAVYAGRLYICEKIPHEVVCRYFRDKTLGEVKSPLMSLSSREREILQLVVEGRSSSEIGALLLLSPKTVETYRSRLMHKLGISDIPGLVKFAIQHGLTTPN
jgi:DNA-binding NarL/FixJ family response regulator